MPYDEQIKNDKEIRRKSEQDALLQRLNDGFYDSLIQSARQSETDLVVVKGSFLKSLFTLISERCK